jgi:cytidyltransferase-like protein
MNIGIVAGSFKPYHKGHHEMVKIAAGENDRVILFVSTTDRLRKDEHPLYGSDMRKTWLDHLEPILPGNVELQLLEPGKPPIKYVYETLIDADDDIQGSDDVFTLYSDPVDLEKNYKSLENAKDDGGYLSTEFIEKNLRKRGVPVSETTEVRGTNMRRFLADGDQVAFKEKLPDELSPESKQAIFDTLSGKALQEAMLRAFIRTAID